VPKASDRTIPAELRNAMLGAILLRSKEVRIFQNSRQLLCCAGCAGLSVFRTAPGWPVFASFMGFDSAANGLDRKDSAVHPADRDIKVCRKAKGHYFFDESGGICLNIFSTRLTNSWSSCWSYWRACRANCPSREAASFSCQTARRPRACLVIFCASRVSGSSYAARASHIPECFLAGFCIMEGRKLRLFQH